MQASPSVFPPLLKCLFWMLVIVVAVLSMLPVEQLPPQTLNMWDKAQHALGFAALTAVGLLAYPKRQRAVVLGLLVFGAGIECAQASTSWRQGDVLDWLADALGIGAMLLVSRLLARVMPQTS